MRHDPPEHSSEEKRRFIAELVEEAGGYTPLLARLLEEAHRINPERTVALCRETLERLGDAK